MTAENEAISVEQLPEDVISGISDDHVRQVAENLSEENPEPLQNILSGFSDIDRAELLEKLGEEDREAVLRICPDCFSPYSFFHLDPELRKKTLSSMDPEKVALIISELDSDDALDIIVNLDQDFQQEIIKKLSRRSRIVLEEGLSFPEDSAGRLMQREYVAIPHSWTVGKAIDYLRAATDDLPDEFFDIFVIDPRYHVIGEIPLNRLIRSKRSEKLESICLEENHRIPAMMDQEEVANIFRRENLTSAPVIDEHSRLIGVITIDDIIDVIDEEAEEDILRMSGVSESNLYTSMMETSWRRLRWLVITLFNALIASFVISKFEATLDEVVALAILMPIVAAMGGNAGMQVVTVTVRALATKEISTYNLGRIVFKEFGIGLINGIAFGLLTGFVAFMWFQNDVLGLVLASAMILNMLWAGIAGIVIPVLLTKANIDPALAAGPFLTTTTDILGFLLFLGIATLAMT